MSAILSHPSAEALALITAAFYADPAARWINPDEDCYQRSFPSFAAAFAGAAFEMGTDVQEPGGVALWLPPGAGPDEEKLGILLQESVPTSRLADVFALFEELGRRHPTESHWYLPIIGVVPEHQGQGMGASLMRRALHRCDEDRLPAYLESTNPRNIAFYERFGFRSQPAIRVADGPEIVPMWREAN